MSNSIEQFRKSLSDFVNNYDFNPKETIKNIEIDKEISIIERNINKLCNNFTTMSSVEICDMFSILEKRINSLNIKFNPTQAAT